MKLPDWSRVSMMALATGKTTAICNAAKSIGATVVVRNQIVELFGEYARFK